MSDAFPGHSYGHGVVSGLDWKGVCKFTQSSECIFYNCDNTACLMVLLIAHTVDQVNFTVKIISRLRELFLT